MVSASRILGRATARIDRLDDRRFALLAILPGALFVGLLVLPPILAAFGLSFFRVELARDANTPFVGIRNFERLVADETFLATIPRTLDLRDRHDGLDAAARAGDRTRNQSRASAGPASSASSC